MVNLGSDLEVLHEQVKNRFRYDIDITSYWQKMMDALFICIDGCSECFGWPANKLEGVEWKISAACDADFGEMS